MEARTKIRLESVYLKITNKNGNYKNENYKINYVSNKLTRNFNMQD